MTGKSYRELMLTTVTLKDRSEMEFALSRIETGGLPDEVIKEVRDHFYIWAGKKKALNGALALLGIATRVVAQSAVSNDIFQDFQAKSEEYIKAITANATDAELVIQFHNLHN